MRISGRTTPSGCGAMVSKTVVLSTYEPPVVPAAGMSQLPIDFA